MNGRFTLFHLDSERSFRGGERQLLYLACALRGLSQENVVVCRPGFPLDKEARRLGLETFHLPFLGEWDPVSAWRLRRRAQACARPLLHAHTAHTAALASLASRLGGPPWVAHRRVDFSVGSALSRRLKYDAAGKVIAVSDFVRRVLLEDGLAPERIGVVRDCLPLGAQEAALGADPRRACLPGDPPSDREAGTLGNGAAHLRPPNPEERSAARSELARQWGLPQDAPWIGNLAALVPHKDQATLLRCAPKVLAQRPDARFVLVGSGPLETELRALAAQLGLGEQARFVGFSDKPTTWLRALDLFVLSSWGEGMGSVLLEAMACGLPVVATSAGGIPEVVAPGRTGLLVPPREPEALARAILEALSGREAAARRAAAARETLKEFSLSRTAERMVKIYEEVVS